MSSLVGYLLLPLAIVAPCIACSTLVPLPIKLFNDAQAANLTLQQAKSEAAWLLRSVCLKVDWIHCSVIHVGNLTDCPAPVPSMELHILASTNSLDLTRNSLGVAFPTQGQSRAGVFLLRVREMVSANAGIIDEGCLLGHVIAHEIGHLLLRSNAHSNEGLMRAEFHKGDLRKAAQRQLRFTKSQLADIQRNILMRAN